MISACYLKKEEGGKESSGHLSHNELTDICPLICSTESDRTTPQSVNLEFIIKGLWGHAGVTSVLISLHDFSHDYKR